MHELILAIDSEPPSLQSSNTRKRAFQEKVRIELEEHDFAIVDEVHVSVEWLHHEMYRYEQPRVADIDNILKPLLDALSGPQGVLVDDSVVQSLSCGWLGWTRHDHRLELRITDLGNRDLSEISISRESLSFLRLSNGMMMPLDRSLPNATLLQMIECVEQTITLRDYIRERTNDYFAGQRVMPIMKLFHPTRVRWWPLTSIEELHGD